MIIKPLAGTILASCLICSIATADDASTDDNMRYFVVIGNPLPEVWHHLVKNPVDPEVAARKFVQSIEGAKLIDYYLFADSPSNLAIIAVPDASDAATIVYQRMSTQLVSDIKVREVIPGRQFKAILEAAKNLSEDDVYSKPLE